MPSSSVSSFGPCDAGYTVSSLTRLQPAPRKDSLLSLLSAGYCLRSSSLIDEESEVNNNMTTTTGAHSLRPQELAVLVNDILRELEEDEEDDIDSVEDGNLNDRRVEGLLQ